MQASQLIKQHGDVRYAAKNNEMHHRMLDKDCLKEIIKNGEKTTVDFKAEHHACNLEYVHDILCLANALDDSDRYLIYGVEDSGNICGLTTIKKENDFLDLIKRLPLNRFPEIQVQKFKFDKKDVQVLIIKNKKYKPYYLLEDYFCKSNSCLKKCKTNDKQPRFLRVGAVYTRDFTTNTPKDRTANESQIHEMWEERFGIRLDPFSRIKQYIVNEQYGWRRSSKDIEDQDLNAAIYVKYPEFKMEMFEIEEPNYDFYEPWKNEASRRHKLGLNKVALKYHASILHIVQLINIEYKWTIPLPKFVHKDESYIISKSSIDFKVAAILNIREDSPNKFLEYADELQSFINQWQPEFNVILTE